MKGFEEFMQVKQILSEVSNKDIEWQSGTEAEKITKLQIKMIEKDIQINDLINRISELESNSFIMSNLLNIRR